ncbi:hypothetical protein [Kribbella sp. HUAS MG21]|uniref:Uncharacterized protein n=1 Tax=Kribbella sp. HUAS MG21 TaxID=3160966 RepID=A0AAU7T9E3_9ACTN
MRNSDLGNSTAFSRRGRDAWRPAQTRTVRYQAGTPRRAVPRRTGR